MEVMVRRLGPCDPQASLPLRVRAERQTLAYTVKVYLVSVLAAYLQALFKQACPVLEFGFFISLLSVLLELQLKP